MVITWTASASDSRRRSRSSALSSPPASAIRSFSQPVRALVPSWARTASAWRSWPTWRRSVICRSPSSRARSRAGNPSSAVINSSSDATPSRWRRSAHRRSFVRQGVRVRFGGCAQVGRTPAEEAGEGGGPGPARVGGPLQGLQEQQPLPGDVGGEDAAAAGDHGGHPGPAEGGGHHVGFGVGPHQDGDVGRVDRWPGPSRRRRGRVSPAPPPSRGARRCRRPGRRRWCGAPSPPGWSRPG